MIALLAEIAETAAQVSSIGLPAGVVSYIVYRELLERRREKFIENNTIRVVSDDGKPSESRTTIERTARDRALEEVWRKNTSESLRKLSDHAENTLKQQDESIGILKTIRDGIAALNDKIERLGNG